MHVSTVAQNGRLSLALSAEPPPEVTVNVCPWYALSVPEVKACVWSVLVTPVLPSPEAGLTYWVVEEPIPPELDSKPDWVGTPVCEWLAFEPIVPVVPEWEWFAFSLSVVPVTPCVCVRFAGA